MLESVRKAENGVYKTDVASTYVLCPCLWNINFRGTEENEGDENCSTNIYGFSQLQIEVLLKCKSLLYTERLPDLNSGVGN